MPVHHLAIAVKDVQKAHDFYTHGMGFSLAKVVKRQAPGGGWTKHIFYDIGDGTLFAIWDLQGLEGVVLESADWRGGMSTGVGLPYWINHVAFQCADREELEQKKKLWLDYGKNVVEVDHEFIVSIYTKDPDGTLVEWTYATRPLNEADREEAERLLADDSPAAEPDYEGTIFTSPLRGATDPFDHHSEEFAGNWRAVYRHLRRRGSVVHTDRHGGFYVAARYDDVRTVLRDPQTFACGRDLLEGHQGGVTVPANPVRMGMMEMDPPESTQYRRILSPRFSATAVERYQPRMTQLIDSCIDGVIERGTLDFVDDLAVPVPALVTLDFLGLPLDNWERYADIMHKAAYRQAGSAREIRRLLEELRSVVRAKRAQMAEPTTLVDDLVSARVDGEPIAEDVVVELLFMLLNGGIDTSTALIAHMFLLLDEHPEARQRLVDRPDRIPAAVEELIRYVTPGTGIARTVTQPTTISDVELRPGDRVWLALGSANNDEAEFPDPDRLDFEREGNRHLAFGHGLHRCLGHSLASAEFVALLERVLHRMPDYRIDRDAVVRYPTIPLVNGFVSVPATFTPGARQDNHLRAVMV